MKIKEEFDNLIKNKFLSFENVSENKRVINSISKEKYIPYIIQEINNTNNPIEVDGLLKAINNIKKVPVIHDPIILVRPKIYYKFADPELESMSTLNKQFLRMGPVNTLLIQDKLNEIASLIKKIPPTQN